MNLNDAYMMTIDGALTAGETTIDVINPATGAVFAAAPDCSKAQLDAAVEAAGRAFRTWRKTPIAERQALVAKAGDLLIANADEMARLLTREQGRPVDAAKIEIARAGAWMKGVAELTPPVHVLEDSPVQLVEVRYMPLGVVCAIAPWNFPVSQSMWKAAPALVAGNTVVLKPSPFTPLCTLKIGELFQSIFPPGVLNVISGGDALGPMMTSHPGFAKISFTGSTATGKSVMESASKDLKRLTLELGGNDAAIVLDDVDPKVAAPQVFAGATMNAGQVCLAIKRLYVHESQYDAMCEELVKLANETIVDDGMKQGTQMGPVQNKQQYEKVLGYIEDARQRGKIIAGGEKLNRKGYFIPPTIVRDIPDDARLVREEQFGPVLPVLRYKDVDDAVARANDTEYGLGGTVWSNNLDRALGVAQRIESGTVWINKHLDLPPDIPFAGAKKSGFGSEMGVEGLEEFTQARVINMSKAPPGAAHA